MNRTRQYTAAAVCYALAAFAVLGGFIYQKDMESRAYRRQIVNSYQHAFSELVSSMTGMDEALQKCAVSGTAPMMSETCMEVYGKSMAAKMALGELPFSDIDFENTSGFISKTGDYAFMISKKTSRGTPCTDEEMKNLRSLSDTTSVLADNYLQLLSQMGGGAVTLDRLLDLQRQAASDGKRATENVFAERVKVAEEEFPEIPSLIYDGPFSSHITDMTPRLTQGEREISADEAAKIAADFMGASQESIKPDGERGGNLPLYSFTLTRRGGEAVNLEVSKAGGRVVNVYSSRAAGESAISADKAVETAKAYLAQKGFADMRESYRMTQGGVTSVNFAYTQGGVICYPDLIKVGVAMDTGEVTGFEAQGFVMNHHARELVEPQVTEEQARERVSRDLRVLSHELAVIPTAGKNELLCHEFKCETQSGGHCIVYVDAATGFEARILMLIENENGTLAI
jgi:germination protein YpeB